MTQPSSTQPPRVVIVGGGFGGLKLARQLRRSPVSITLIDRNNYHLFQPLLYQVATAGLSPADIAMPIRSVLRRDPEAEVIMGEVTGIDAEKREVIVRDPAAGADSHTVRVSYDFLVIATGARHSYFGHPEWEAFAPGLKSIEDATAIRTRILLAFEKAEVERDEEERKRLLTFTVVGGGPTGVEMAGAISELAKRVLASDFRHIDPTSACIVIVEAGPRVLGAFPEELSRRAEAALSALGVEVRTGQRVEKVDADGVIIGGKRLGSRTVVWAAGVEATPVCAWLGLTPGPSGRVRVGADLSVPGHPHIFVIGDAAWFEVAPGVPLPGVAPVAIQQGAFLAKLIAKRVSRDGAGARETFRYFDKGSLATIGRSCAVAAIGGLRMSGFFAWLTWLFVHILYLVGFRNRVSVVAQWAWSYATFQRGARLITKGHAR
jgi:NADH:ubiquinone reductase (H+-translocating)